VDAQVPSPVLPPVPLLLPPVLRIVPGTQRPVAPSQRLPSPQRASPATQSAVHFASASQYCPLMHVLPTSHAAPHWIFESHGLTRLSSTSPQLAKPPPTPMRATQRDRPTPSKIVLLTVRAIGQKLREERAPRVRKEQE
jgi:hypothetical protein